MFQQDRALFHTTRLTQAHLEENTPEFIKKDEWPPRSPDCNPLDYAIGVSLKEKVCREVQGKLTEQTLMNRKIMWEEISIEETRKSISA